MSEDRRLVECVFHGPSDSAFICRHLVRARSGPLLGFHQAAIDPYNREWGDLNGWCDQCDEIYLAEGAWNDVSEGFAGITLVCSGCFFDMKARHGRSDETT
jgi:hypothetical protein